MDTIITTIGNAVVLGLVAAGALLCLLGGLVLVLQALYVLGKGVRR